MSRRASVAAFLVLVLVTGAAAWVALFAPGSPEPTPPGKPASPTPSVSATPGLGSVVSVRAIAAGPAVAYDQRLHRAPLSESAQRRIWWAGDRWWAVLPDAISGAWDLVAAGAASGPWTSQGIVDERRRVQIDVAVRGDELLVAAAGTGGENDALRVRRYLLTEGRYVLVPDSPMEAHPTGVRALSAGIAPDGSAWLAFVAGERLQVAQAAPGGGAWRPGPVLAGEAARRTPSVVAVAATATDLAVVWSTDGSDRIWIERVVGDAWQEREVEIGAAVDGALSAVGVPGTTDIMALLGVRTTGAPEAPATVVIRVPEEGRGSVAVVALEGDHFAEPGLVLVPSASAVVAFATGRTPDGGTAIMAKAASLDTLSFTTGAGDPVLGGAGAGSMRSVLVPAVASPAGEIAIAGVGGETSAVWSATVLVGGAAPRPAPEPLAAPASVALVRQSFDALAAGERPAGWQLLGDGASLGVVDEASGGRSLRVGASTIAAGRACIRFPGVTEGILEVQASVRLNRVGGADGWMAVRGRGDAATVLFDDDLTLGYRRAATKVRLETAYAVGVRYRWTARIDLAAGRYTWTLANASGAVVARVRDVAWSVTELAAIDTLCVEIPAGTRTPSIDLDDVAITHVLPVPSP